MPKERDKGQQSVKRFKFGIVYTKEKQVTDDEFLGNGAPPPPFPCQSVSWDRGTPRLTPPPPPPVTALMRAGVSP